MGDAAPAANIADEHFEEFDDLDVAQAAIEWGGHSQDANQPHSELAAGESNIRLATSPEAESNHHGHAGLNAIQSLIRGKRDVTWVFSGDNVIQGAFSTHGLRNCVELFSERIRAELRRAGDVVINTGVSGDTARQLLETLQRRTLRYRPDVVCLSVGLNDAKNSVSGRNRFRRHIREILERVRTAGAIPLVILPHPVYSTIVSNRDDLPHYVEILREECVRDEVPYIDHWGVWLQNWPEPEETRTRLFDGRIQLNAASHQHLAALIFHTLEIYDPDSTVCRLA